MTTFKLKIGIDGMIDFSDITDNSLVGNIISKMIDVTIYNFDQLSIQESCNHY